MCIANCKGCDQEFNDAYWYQQDLDLFVATSIDFPEAFPVGKGHYFILMVNEKGKIIVGK